MKPIYEPIIPNTNTSFKVKSYSAEAKCESAGWHIHPEYEIVYVRNGSGVLKIGNKVHNYKDGVLVFLAGNIPHSDFGNYDHMDSLEVVIQFTQEFVYEKLGLFPEFDRIKKLIEKSKNILVFDPDTKTELGQHFERFDTLDNQGKLINFLDILSHLSSKTNPLKLLTPGISIEFRERETDRLKKVFEYVNTHYSQKIEIIEIAALVGLTPNSFSRFFKKMTNRTFIDFVNEFRVGRAVDNLNESDISVAEAMYLSGFNSPSYFTKQFLKYQRTTPSGYLKQGKSLR